MERSKKEAVVAQLSQDLAQAEMLFFDEVREQHDGDRHIAENNSGKTR